MKLTAKSFALGETDGVVTITLDRPDRLNSLTFEVYRELADVFDALTHEAAARAVILTGRGRGFCSGGDQDDIIKELFSRDMQGLLEFTRMTGRLIGAMVRCEKPIIAAVNGVCVGAGAVMAAASDMRIAARGAKFGFIFPRVGLCGADMGAGYLLPRLIGRAHAAEILFRGEIFDADHALKIGFVNRVEADAGAALALAQSWATDIADGPAFAHSMTKKMLLCEDGMTLEAALEAEAQAQAICMQHPDFRIAHDAFKAKRKPVFTGRGGAG